MITLIVGIVMLFAGFKLGRVYQDFQDIMLARRVSKLVSQREQLSKEQDDYDRAVKLDRKIARRELRLLEESEEIV